jgi:hypothetical protein
MSLLIDARRKSQLAHNANESDSSHSAQELASEPRPASPPTSPAPDNRARIAGQNLFNAKSFAPSFARARINRNLLIALGGTILLLIAGAGYVWYIISPGNTQPSRPISMPAVASPVKPAPATTPPQNNLVPQIASSPVARSEEHTSELQSRLPDWFCVLVAMRPDPTVWHALVLECWRA